MNQMLGIPREADKIPVSRFRTPQVDKYAPGHFNTKQIKHTSQNMMVSDVLMERTCPGVADDEIDV